MYAAEPCSNQIYSSRTQTDERMMSLIHAPFAAGVAESVTNDCLPTFSAPEFVANDYFCESDINGQVLDWTIYRPFPMIHCGMG